MSVQSSDPRTKESTALVVISAALGVILVLLALALWLTFGSDVFARMGASVWALCF